MMGFIFKSTTFVDEVDSLFCIIYVAMYSLSEVDGYTEKLQIHDW